jgi:hypothetical protein
MLNYSNIDVPDFECWVAWFGIVTHQSHVSQMVTTRWICMRPILTVRSHTSQGVLHCALVIHHNAGRADITGISHMKISWNISLNGNFWVHFACHCVQVMCHMFLHTSCCMSQGQLALMYLQCVYGQKPREHSRDDLKVRSSSKPFLMWEIRGVKW